MSDNRLRWRCRRGMLELDLLLQGFLEHGYRRLTSEQRALFAGDFLALPDQQLHDYLLGHATPEDTDVAQLVERIRAAYP